MEKSFLIYPILSIAVLITIYSCKKDYSCAGCPNDNRSPVANAGADTIIILPGDSALLNGSATYDPDGTITSFKWTKIAGPFSYNMSNSDASKCWVTHLIKGVYQFELRVTDNSGLYARDTVQLAVTDLPAPSGCNDNTRQIIHAQLIPVGLMSEGRVMATTAAGGNKIFFVGNPGSPSATIDIYDVMTDVWTTSQLSIGRTQMATVTAGNKIFFAGGGWYDAGGDIHPSKRIDILDLSTNTWSIDSLSEARYDLAAAAVGDKVIFAGGVRSDQVNDFNSSRVDIYNLSTHSWSNAVLSEPRSNLSAVTLGDSVYFAGGFTGFNTVSGNTEYLTTDRIDIYDNISNSWSISSLTEAKQDLAAIAAGNKIFWAGGNKTRWGNATSYNWASCKVEIRNPTAGNTINYLYNPEGYLFDEGQNALIKDNKIVFFTGTYSSIGDTRFNIYDIATETWFIGVLPFGLSYTSVVAVNNNIYVGGGYINGNFLNATNQVWRLQF
jgi:hypothetical protein